MRSLSLLGAKHVFFVRKMLYEVPVPVNDFLEVFLPVSYHTYVPDIFDTHETRLPRWFPPVVVVDFPRFFFVMQEVPFEQGLQMLKAFHQHKHVTSIVDDYGFYENRAMQHQRSRHQHNHQHHHQHNGGAGETDTVVYAHVDVRRAVGVVPAMALPSICGSIIWHDIGGGFQWTCVHFLCQ